MKKIKNIIHDILVNEFNIPETKITDDVQLNEMFNLDMLPCFIISVEHVLDINFTTTDLDKIIYFNFNDFINFIIDEYGIQ